MKGLSTLRSRTATLVLAGVAAAAVMTLAQTPAAQSRRFTAVTDNVSGAKTPVKIELARWSTDAERDQLLAAWNLTPAGRGGRGGGGRGRGAGGRGAEDPAPDPAAVGASDPFGAFRGGAAPAAAGRGGAGVASPRPTPEGALAGALARVPTLGYLWSSEVAGYAIRYAFRVAEQDGSERIVLVTNRRLGDSNDLWKPVGPAAETTYPFTVLELHLNAKGEGEGKSSLSGKVTVDSAAKTIALDNYAASPVLLRSLKNAPGK